MRKPALWLCLCLFLALFGCASSPASMPPSESHPIAEKPVLYLYPETQTEVRVTLELDGELLFSYPSYESGWEVLAQPNGTLLHEGRAYSYLFWEGQLHEDYDMSRGFVVPGEDTEAFLTEKLQYLGLTPREYNEFLVYWLPQMVQNPYNLITFQNEAYTQQATLHIEPQPDSIQRVFMVYKALQTPIDIEPQHLETFSRRGFTAIEWGGAELHG